MSHFILNYMDGYVDIRGWQWLYIIQGIPTVLVGISVWFVLPDSPESVNWLTNDEKMFVVTRLDNKDEESSAISWREVLKTIMDPEVLAVAFICFCCVTTLYTISFFLPALMAAFKVDPLFANLLTAPAHGVGVIFSLFHAWVSDKTGEHLTIVGYVSAMASGMWILLAYALLDEWNLYAQYAVVTLLVGFSTSMLPPLFAHLTMGFSNTTRTATGSALVVSVANVGGYVGPKLMALSFEHSGTYAYAVASLSVFAGVGALGCFILIYCIRRPTYTTYPVA